MAMKLVWLAAAGMLGTFARYGLQGLVQRNTGGALPWGTLVVNVVGCFLFGLVWVAASERHLVGAELRIVLLVGFMGAFTTFSSYVFETGELLRGAQWGLAAANFLMENVMGFLGLMLGMLTGRAL